MILRKMIIIPGLFYLFVLQITISFCGSVTSSVSGLLNREKMIADRILELERQ